MNAPAETSPPRVNWRLLALVVAGGLTALVIAANVHLVYVAVGSQPDCVAHAKETGQPGAFRAAKPAC
ncbi:hypothetical protein AB4144_03595 [Rhizobiaceae sp. 2RAB30]